MEFFNFFSSHKEKAKQPQQREAQFQSAIFADLSQTQKFAMLASLAAAPTDAEKTAMAQKMMLIDAALMGITQDMLLDYMQTHTKFNAQVEFNESIGSWIMDIVVAVIFWPMIRPYYSQKNEM